MFGHNGLLKRLTDGRNASQIRFLLRYTKRYYRWVAAISCFIVISLTASMVLPLISRAIIDKALMARNWDLLKTYVGLYFVIILVASLFNTLRDYVYAIFSNRMFHEIRSVLFCKLLRASPSITQEFSEGDLFAILMDDAKVFRTFILEVVLASLTDLLVCVIAFIFIYHLSPMVAALVLIFIPLYICAYRLLNNLITRFGEMLRESRGRFYSYTMEAMRLLAGIKGCNAYDHERNLFRDASADFLKKRLRSLMLMTGLHQASLLMMLSGSVLIWLVGGMQVIEGGISLGTLIALNEYFLRFASPLSNLGAANASYRGDLVSVKKCQALLEYAEEEVECGIEEAKVSADLVRGSGHLQHDGRRKPALELLECVQFDKVSFSLPGRRDFLIKDLKLQFKRGDKLAIIGRSGVGKTTLARMLIGIVEPDMGEILLNNAPLKHWDLSTVRDRIAYVPQTPFIFSRSIGENIRYNRAASDKAVLDMVRFSFLTDFIASKENRFDHAVSADGLSGGEAQKISLARGLLRGSDLYIFDESFSNIDKAASISIVESILSLADKTAIFITHDLVILEKLQHVYLFDDGKLTYLRDASTVEEYVALLRRGTNVTM